MRRTVCFASLVFVVVSLTPGTADGQHIVGVRDDRALRADSVFQRFDRTDSPGWSGVSNAYTRWPSSASETTGFAGRSNRTAVVVTADLVAT